MINDSFYQENSNIREVIVGEFVDTIMRHDDNGVVIETVENTPIKNIITIGISTLMAGLIIGNYQGNNTFWAVGTGVQAASPYLTNLVAEYNRKQVAISFVDNNNAITITPTNRLVMSAAWAQGELGVVTLTEFGLFSGTNASQANGGLMIDYVAHAPISLDSTLSLSRKIYFTF